MHSPNAFLEERKMNGRADTRELDDLPVVYTRTGMYVREAARAAAAADPEMRAFSLTLWLSAIIVVAFCIFGIVVS